MSSIDCRVRTIVCWFALFSLGLAISVEAQQRPMSGQASNASTSHTCRANGCGPDGWFGMVVPNEIAGCSFKPACDSHDICYSKCLSCHSYSDSPICYGLDNRRMRQAECDTDFRADLVKASGGSKVCLLASRIYHRVVTDLGVRYHRGLTATPGDEAERDAEFKRRFEAEFAKAKAAD